MLADRRALFSDCFCSLYAIIGLFRQSPFFATDLRLSKFAARCLLYTAHISLMTACYSRLHFCCSLLAIGCFLLAVPFLILAALLSFPVTRPLGARCVLPTGPCLLLLTRYSRASCRFFLLASCRPLIAARTRILFIHAHGVLFAFHRVNLLLTDARRSPQSAYYSHHSTLIASHTLYLVVRRFLIEICCFLLADRYALLNSYLSLLFASHSVLVTRILLLDYCCFLL